MGGILLTDRQSRKSGGLHKLLVRKVHKTAARSFFTEGEAAARFLAERVGALQAVIKTSTVGIAEVDTTTCQFVQVNSRFCGMTGRTEDELLNGLGPADVVHPDDLEAEVTRWQVVRHDGKGWDVEQRYLQPGGSVAWVRLSMTVSARDADTRPTHCVAIVQDVTEYRTAIERLRSSEEMLRVGQIAGRIGSFRRDLATGALHCSPELRRIFGLPATDEPLPSDEWMQALVPEDRPRLAALIRDAMVRRDAGISCDFRIRRSLDGALRYVEMRARYEFDAQGKPVASAGVLIDVTERRHAEERLRVSEEMLRLSLAIGQIGTFWRNLDTGEVEGGPELRRLLGLPAADGPIPIGALLSIIVPGDRARTLQSIHGARACCEPDLSCDFRIRRASDGLVRHIEMRAHYEYAEDGRAIAAAGVAIDVTERREAEAQVAHMAHHDALTGLPNRLRLRQRLDEALAWAGRGEGFAVLCVDLDRFKEVNDTLGHPTGDAVLRAVADRFRAELRETDTLARLGGDEFAIVQAGIDQPSGAIALARWLVAAGSVPLDIDGQHVSVGASVGIALAPEDGLDPDALLRGADMALYRAKADGRGTWRFFEPEMDARMQMRRVLELDLRRALAAREFEVYYQPIVGVMDRQVTGLEALVRWHHPERGLVPPDHFIPLCEEIGLVIPLGAWVLRQACSEAVSWPGRPKVAINLSAAQFASTELVECVAAALAASGLEPRRLELEITETVMLRDAEATLATLHRLKALGVRIAMDDFGTGYSSLSYLQRFPFDKVKIDRGFVCSVDDSRKSTAIVRAVTDLCSALDMTTTAEGVETEEQFAALRRQGCDEAQGYLFSRPQPAADVPAMLADVAAAASRGAA
ncbi:sensor domain-containing protein [Muricoccus aerilatus]|uniref:sensor domain-containing protein n=1 Tax=Muricoccus aerilatus TaxID=452982 RepID=UPI00069409A4|nr:bifunctional diguanylate cyclase/phosphodiesterase [Roseomonas aerilata]